LTAFVGEMAGIVGASRSAVQDLCTSVCGIPLSKGVIQKLAERVSAAILPYSTAIGEVARAALVNYLDETSWRTSGDRRWLWVMANPEVAYFQIPLNRSKAAFAQRITDWRGSLVSDGYLVSQGWQGLRQSCLAHLIRTAQGLAERVEAGLARLGGRVHTELHRLCHMGTERPTVGQWRAWYARFSALLTQHAAEHDGACPVSAGHERGSRAGSGPDARRCGHGGLGRHNPNQGAAVTANIFAIRRTPYALVDTDSTRWISGPGRRSVEPMG
jgi:transposase